MRTQKQILTAIQHVAINGKALDESVQSIGLDILQHVEANGEVSLACKLLRALPKGARAKALADWFQMFGKIVVNTDKATAKQFPLVFHKEGKTNLEGAAAKQWYKCKPDRPLAEEFDFAAQLTALLKRAAEAEAKGMTVKGADALAKCRGLV
jgi:hypothetical protein